MLQIYMSNFSSLIETVLNWTLANEKYLGVGYSVLDAVWLK
jgi:hypothetical protein